MSRSSGTGARSSSRHVQRTSIGYCRCSADPVGHLILYLFGYRDRERQQLSDQICTGLQLANFWQDVAVDLERDRIYIPADSMRQFGVTEAQIKLVTMNPAERIRSVIRFFSPKYARAGTANVITIANPLKIAPATK